MAYPPDWRRIEATGPAIVLMREHPFAHLLTMHSGLRCTRLPFVADAEEGRIVRLRGHLNRHNPQTDDLDRQEVLVSFSGPSSYVSPHWRTTADRAGTIDYQEVQVRGVLRTSDDLGSFRALVNDLAALFEPQYAEVGDYPVWNSSMAPEGYIERLFPAIVAFEIEVRSIAMVSKLHQSFPKEDRLSIIEHLNRSSMEEARTIAARMKETIR